MLVCSHMQDHSLKRCEEGIKSSRSCFTRRVVCFLNTFAALYVAEITYYLQNSAESLLPLPVIARSHYFSAVAWKRTARPQ